MANETVQLLDGSIQEGEFVNFFNAGYDSGMVVKIGERHVYCAKRVERDAQGNITREWREELPGYENYP